MRFFYFLLFSLITACSAEAQIGYGPELGLGISTMQFAPPMYPDYTSASVSAIFSGKIGGLIDIPLNKHLTFQGGLSLAREGAVRSFSYYTNDSNSESVHQTLYINYFNLPLNLIYKTGTQGRGRFIFGIGAVPAYIIGGRNKLQDQLVVAGVSSDTISNTQIAKGITVSGFDISLNITAGYELPTGLFFRAYYSPGMENIGIGTEIDKNRMWGISAGYIFGKRHNINKQADDLIDKSTEP